MARRKKETETIKEQPEEMKEEIREQKEVPEVQPPTEKPKAFISTSTKKQREARKARIQTHDLSPKQIAKNLGGK